MVEVVFIVFKDRPFILLMEGTIKEKEL